MPNHIKPAIGGLLVGVLALWVPEILSTGYGWIQKAMTGNYIGGFLIWLALLKIIAMSLTISSGGSGGVFGPNVYIGGMLGAWVAYEADRWIPGVGFMPPAFAVVGMAAVFAGTARVPVATMVMVAEMTGGYGLIVPSMLATALAFVVQRTIAARSRYPRLYEAQVELRTDSPTHYEQMLRAAFAVLEAGPLVNLHNVTFPHLVSLLRHGTPIPIHNGQGFLTSLAVGEKSPLAGRTVAEMSELYPEMVAAAVIRAKQVLYPRGATRLQAGDQLLVVAGRDIKIEAVQEAEGGGSL